MADIDVPVRDSAINTAASAANTPDSNRDALQFGRDAWQSTVTTWRAAQAAYVAHPYPNIRPGHPDYERLDQEASALSDAEAVALDAVMDAPAPDHPAVIEKLEIIKAEFGDDFYIDRLIADVRRLGTRALWDELMARYLAAKTEEDDYFEHVHAPLFDGDPTADTDEHERVDAALGRLANLRCNLQMPFSQPKPPMRPHCYGNCNASSKAKKITLGQRKQ